MKLQHLFTHKFAPGEIYLIPDAPFSILWDVCYVCNQRCRFCYNSEYKFQRSFPKEDVVKRIIDILCHWGIGEIIYLGGEPTLYPKLKDIVMQAHSHGIDQRLITNGRMVASELMEIFYQCNVEIGVSLHGINPKIHNNITQTQKSFESALETIRRLSAAKVKWYIQYTPIQNTESFYAAAFQLKKIFPQLSLIDVNRLMPQGSGIDTVQNIISEDMFWNCLKDIPKIKQLGIRVSLESIPHCWVYSRSQTDNLSVSDQETIINAIRPCYMGINQIGLDDQGRFKLCPGGEACTESILEKDAKEIWLNSECLQRRRRFDFLPQRCIDVKKAKACKYFYQCGGGCKMSLPKCSANHSVADYLIV